ncbi:MAG TPA: prepilin-type N-terminal cleavage/methylation domain-containing protein [Rudaea sp.]|jgi:general secretion pathway protein I
MEPGVIVARRATPSFHKSGGFTLIELIAAFVIFALGFGILLQILGSALHTTRQSAEYTKAALWAQSLLDVQGIGEPLKEGGSSGQFDDTYGWQLNVTRYQPQAVAGATQVGNPGALVAVAPGQPEIFQLELIVSWGNAYLTHHARFVTLRVMGPTAPGNAPGNLPIGSIPGFG